MINFPYISLPDYYTRLLSGNYQQSLSSNLALESYITENKEMAAIVKKIFRDIDNEGFLGKIISVAGWTGIRNRLAAAYIEKSITGKYPEIVDLKLVSDILDIDNHLRHFAPGGYHRGFLLGFYAKMTQIYIENLSDSREINPLVINNEHLELMRYSKGKSIKIDWLLFQLVQFQHFYGKKRLESFLDTGTDYEAFFNLLSPNEQKQFLDNVMTYASSINDTEIFLTDIAAS